MLSFLRNIIKKPKKKTYLEKALEIREKKGYDVFSLDFRLYTQKELPDEYHVISEFLLWDFKGKGKVEVRDIILKLPEELEKETIIQVPKRLKKIFETGEIKLEDLNKRYKTEFKIK